MWFDSRIVHYPASVAVTWETTLIQLVVARALLRLLAWLAPMPRVLFRGAAATEVFTTAVAGPSGTMLATAVEKTV